MKRKQGSNSSTRSKRSKSKQAGTDSDSSNETKPERCKFCKQNLENVKLYKGHLNKSCEEFVALTNESLSLFTGEEENIYEGDELPVHKITCYSVYDANGHLCSFDSGLVEKNVILHVSGYVKPIYDDDPSSNNGIPAHDMGPINEWYISGFDGGEKALVGIVTAYAQYVLMDPSPEYAEFVKTMFDKMALVKLVIEFLNENLFQEPTYEDLLLKLENAGDFRMCEDFLLQHAQFVCDQVYSYDQAGGEDDTSMITLPCVRTLVQLAGVKFRKRQKMRKTEAKEQKKRFTKATTSALVRSIFENFFPDQIEMKDGAKRPKMKRCGVCDACQSPDCGKCGNCKDMIKFGGTGKMKQACKTRKCPNMAVEDAEMSENEEDDASSENGEEGKDKKPLLCAKRNVNTVAWTSECCLEEKGRKYYDSADVGQNEIVPGDFVMLKPENPSIPFYIGKVEYMYEKMLQGPTVHIQMLVRGTDTVLGEVADPRELFVGDECEDCPLGSVTRKAEVKYVETPADWALLGGNEAAILHHAENDDHTFFYSKLYHKKTAAFTNFTPIEKLDKSDIKSCDCCIRRSERKIFKTPILNEDVVTWLGTEYKVGSGIFLNPSVYKFKFTTAAVFRSDEVKSVDEKIYPEYWRKTSSEIKGSNTDTPEPFVIGQIAEIWQTKNEIKLKARVFYRPENTKLVYQAHEFDMNLVYWSEKEITTTFDNVAGKCYLRYFDLLEPADDWYSMGPNRFYFNETYSPEDNDFTGILPHVRRMAKSKGKSKGKSSSNTSAKEETLESPPEWEKLGRPLRCMDVFAGCGGLSKGLHMAGIADTKWAIEKEVPAANAFKLNNTDCKVFTTDCNEALDEVMSGNPNCALPRKGEVEMLVGGPPCQGFSGMNRFNAGQYSLFKNSLVVTYLSYCDYYRPKYFVLENVRNFVSFKRSMVLKLTVKCLLAIGYQVKFGIVQAGHYGVPQTRRRLILLAAAPGLVLPKLPEPTNVFSRRGCHLSFALDGNKRFSNGNRWKESAPYRTVTVRDAISDLPVIRNGFQDNEINYDREAVTQFQRKLRGGRGNAVVVDHVCKEMAPIIEARIAHIPDAPGSDWRDLPNISVRLTDGTMSAELKYKYPTKKQKKGGSDKGVCRCALGGGVACDPSDRQVNTLIPWCLPHTADRHSHWAGLYGRLEWCGFFGTTITNPEPMGKQGRVLHPEQNRVVSVRECARSQGFPDNFKFHGNIMDKYRQVGNAVPPPLGEAIGIEIRKALLASNLEIA